MSRRCQQNDRGAEQHFSLPENGIGRGRNGKEWTDTPDQSAWVCGCKKELLGNVANSVRIAVKYRVRLTDHGRDGARDQVPICVDVQRNDGLDVEHFLGALERPGVEIRVKIGRASCRERVWV